LGTCLLLNDGSDDNECQQKPACRAQNFHRKYLQVLSCSPTLLETVYPQQRGSQVELVKFRSV
jgi:hypothetical protein